MPVDNYAGFLNSLVSPASRWLALTPSSTVPLAEIPRALRFDGAGLVTLTGADGHSEPFTVAAGEVLSVRPTYILGGTNTTATGIKGLY